MGNIIKPFHRSKLQNKIFESCQKNVWVLSDIFPNDLGPSEYLTEEKRLVWAPALSGLAFAEVTAIKGIAGRIESSNDIKLQGFFALHLSDEIKHTEGFLRLFSYLYPSKSSQSFLAVTQREVVRYFSLVMRCSSSVEWMASTYILEVFGRNCVREISNCISGDPLASSFLRAVITDEHKHTTYLLHLVKEEFGEMSHAEKSQFLNFVEKMTAICAIMFTRDKTPMHKSFGALEIDPNGFCMRAI